MMTARPQAIDAGADDVDCGYKAVFDSEEFAVAIRKKGCYESAYNIFCLNWRWSASKTVPYKMRLATACKDHFFKTPRTDAPLKFHVALGEGDDPESMFGTLLSLSPLEPLHALAFAVDEHTAAGMDDEQFRTRRSLMLSVTVCFERIENVEKRFWRSLQLRENTTEMGEAVKRSQLDRARDVMEVANSVLKLEITSCNPQTIAQAWQENLEGKLVMDVARPGLIDAVLTVRNRLMCCRECARLV